ncbi:MAG: hypothetical protein MJZ69_08465 [Bacteroidaceae bacterium]|nr:hypothetical protein [Bacteroidaceae bacterium]
MKKLFMLAIVAVGMSFAACSSSIESKMQSFTDDMISAIKAGDMEKVEKIGKEADAWEKSLSPEEHKKLDEVGQKMKAQIEAAMMEYATKMIGGEK